MWPSATVPSGWLHCNGQSVNRNTYQDLFNVIGDDYGADDANHFDVPDMRGLFVRGWANGESEDPDRASRTDRGDGTTGDNVGTLQSDTNKSHTHSFKASNRAGDSDPWSETNKAFIGDLDSAAFTKSGTDKIFTEGGTESRPKNIAMMYIIRAT